MIQLHFQYGQLYQRNYYKEVREKNRVYYELYSLDGTQEVPEHHQRMCRNSWDTRQ